MKEIPLSKGYSTLVDDEDFDFLMQWKWHAQVLRHTVYAVRKPWVAGGKGKSTKIFMHRVLLCTPVGMQSDHMDGNGLNNQRKNLRSVTQQENLFNRAKWVNGCSSRFKGVYRDKRDGVWTAKFQLNGEYFYLGRFKDEEEAYLVYLANVLEILPEAFIRENIL